MTPNKQAVEAAAKADHEMVRKIMKDFATPEWQFMSDKYRTHAIQSSINQITAYHASLGAQGLAETCEHFVWNDDRPHKFGTGEDDMPPVLIIRTDTGEA
jgi:hypothetical protein